MDGLTYERDIRHTNPEISDDRRGNFKAGWDDATERGKAYETSTLVELTWQNLGYRFGRLLGRASDEVQNEMYALCVRQQREKPGL